MFSEMNMPYMTYVCQAIITMESFTSSNGELIRFESN